ncbi:protein ELYS [Cydia fagiglandana]|uniref:protein ELYS n=1 Tax=Cydia fagiglandana TaxID=1458189 RepID=UPI002FEE5B21
MQKLQDSVFSIIKTTNLSPAVFSYLQPSENAENVPLGGILSDTKHGWLALGTKFCVVDLRTGLKVAARTFGVPYSNTNCTITSVIELPTPLTENSKQLIICLECEDLTGLICVLHINGSQILRCIQTDVVITEIAVCDEVPDGPLTCFDGVIMAGSKRGEIFAFDLNRASLIQALKDISQGYEHLVRMESNPANLAFLSLNAVPQIDQHRDQALDNDDHLAIILNENSLVDGQYLFRNPDGSIRMKAKQDHIRVSSLQYVPQLGSLAVGYNFGAFQIWNMMSLELEFASQVNRECLPVTHFGFQEPCDDPRAFCYLWAIFSVMERFEEEEFPLAVMYSLTYQGKRMLSDTKCLYQNFMMATIRFQLELSVMENAGQFIGGRCVSCHAYSVSSTLGEEGEDSMLNICQLVWECWGENVNSATEYGMLLFDLDQWYKDQMPSTYGLQSNAFMSASWCGQLTTAGTRTLDVRLQPGSVTPYSHATRLEEHFYPNSIHYSKCSNKVTTDVAGTRTLDVRLQPGSVTPYSHATRLEEHFYPNSIHYSKCSNKVTTDAAGIRTLDVRLQPGSVTPYSHATRLEEYFYPNSIHYNCICLNTSDACVLNTAGIQRQIIASIDDTGPTALLNPPRLYHACVAAGLTPLYMDGLLTNPSAEEQRRFLLSVALEARLARFLKRCAHDWATGSHHGVGCTLTFLVDWCWRRALQLKENAKELTAPLFSSSSLPDRNVVRCLEHCVQQLTQLTGLLDAILTKCCNLIVPDALSEIEEKYKGVGTVSLYFQVVQWFLRVGLLPERHQDLPYPARQLNEIYTKRRMKLQRLQSGLPDGDSSKSCSLLYIDQLIEHEFGGERIQQMWLKGGSETNGLYPPPSLYSLLRLYLLPDIAEEHKHSLVLYLLVDYSMVYEVRYEAVVRRLMQFPTMFGLSNTAIKATQAFWHLDHRDFDFALDQLQCLTGNTLSPWQHHAVLSALLAQNMTQAALQYLHVRKPAPIQNNRVNDHDKLEDWQSCCNLYLARKLVFEALDVVRMCVQNAASLEEKLHVLNFFFKGCRNTGQLSKILQVTLLPFEEEAFVKYLERCNEPHTSDILIMYYLQQARYLEAQQHNCKLRHTKRSNISSSSSSIVEVMDRQQARDTLVEVVCASLPTIATKVAHMALSDHCEPHIVAAKPMSVFVQAKSPKNTFTYKSSFIQDTIENASETWVNRPKMRRGIKRALSIEDTPFICTPKLSRTKSIFSDFHSEGTPPKRAKFDLTGAATPRTPRTPRGDLNISRQMATLLDMPEVQSPDGKIYDRSGAGTPHSILKIRNSALGRDAPSPVDSRYLGDSDDELLETASNHTHYSDSTNKHLRFTIPTASESGSTPSPPPAPFTAEVRDREPVRQKEMDESMESFVTSTSTAHPMKDENPFESPLKKLATEEKVLSRKSYKDNVRARRSLSISANSSLSEDPNTSIESIADIPITLINPRYRRTETPDKRERDGASPNKTVGKESSLSPSRKINEETEMERGERDSVPRTPRGRRGIRGGGESTPLANRSRSGTPEHVDSPIITPLRPNRNTRSRSRTPEISPRASPLAPIPEQPRQEVESEPHPVKTTLSVQSRLRSRSRTPERMEKVAESPRLEAISESPTKPEEPESPRRRLRSRSRSPQVELEVPKSPRTLRSRSKTPEKLMSPKADRTTKAKKSLTRIVLEANTFKAKNTEPEPEQTKENEELIECTPMKPKQAATMDVSFSPIVNKSVLTETPDKLQSADSSKSNVENLPAFTKINETQFGKSILQSCESSAAETSQEVEKDKDNESVNIKTLPAFTSMNDSIFAKSVLHSYESSVAESSSIHEISVTNEISVTKVTKTEVSIACKSVLKDQSSLLTNDSESESEDNKSNWKECTERVEGTAQDIQKEKERIVEIEREINEIEGDMSDEEGSTDEEIVEGADDDDTDEESSEGDDSMSGSGDDEIISIGDSSAESNDIQLDEQTSSDSNRQNRQIEEQLDEQTSSDSNRQIEELEVNVRESPDTTEQSDRDPLNQGRVSLLTDDNSMSDNEMDLNYDDDEEEESKTTETGSAKIETETPTTETEPAKTKTVTAETEIEPSKTETHAVIKIDVVVEEVNPIEEKETRTATAEAKSTDVVDASSVINKPEDMEVDPIISKTVDIIPKENTEKDKTDKEAAAENKTENKQVEKETNELQKIMETTEQSKKTAENTEKEKPKSRLRKRASSTASNKSNKKDDNKMDVDKTENIETRKPTTRKRAKSTTSNQSEEVEETPSKVSNPTPAMRRLMAKRESKEGENKVESSVTPQRRATRSRSKNDDNVSVTSEDSVRSTRSKASEKEKKGRKSIVAVKPELSAIPEMSVDESKDVSDYSSSRRLTRHQRSLLSTLELRPRLGRATAAATDQDERPPFDVQPIDRISLLNKTDFEGSPDSSEPARQSPETESTVSHSSGRRTPRMARAASESKTAPKAAKIGRRVSVDVVSESGVGSPGSPARPGRRASFNRACEALHTPKGRRVSTDLRKETDSGAGSPAGSEAPGPAAPARRGRRASGHSDTSVTKDTGKRSKKLSTVEESDAKK